MRKFLGVLVLLLFPTFLRAQCTGSSPTWTSTPDEASVSACVTNASAGDTINVSAGTVTWSNSGISTSKGLSIIGAGMGSTVINDAIPTNASSCSLFSMSPTVVGSLTRISGMTIQPANGVTSVCRAIAVQGTCSPSGCPNLRVDHIDFEGWASVTRFNTGYAINAVDDVFGVFDHNTITGVQGNYLQLTQVNHANYLGQSQWGDYSWNQPENYGSGKFLFFENNTFTYASCCENEAQVGILQNRGGGRIVVRFNIFTADHFNQPLTWHGTESNGRSRGGRTWEFYANTYTCDDSLNLGGCGGLVGIRSGTGLTWGDRETYNSSASNIVNMNTYRVANTINWAVCDGTGPNDINDTNGGSGNTGFIYWSGTVASYDSSTHTVTVSGSPGWSANQWTPLGAPYSMHDITQSTAANPHGIEISSNGSNTLTIDTGAQWQAWSPASGDSIQILRAFVCLDQAGGRGAGILYSGNNPAPTPATPLSPANQALSPAYMWANPYSGSHAPNGYVGSDTRRVIANRDWYQDNLNQTAQTDSTHPFNGSSGVGYGTLANRPSTCTAGTAYWQTDYTNTIWNTNSTTIPGISGSTNGALFICASGGWPSSPSYIPYTYPHPIISGSSIGTTAPNPPTGLLATVQ